MSDDSNVIGFPHGFNGDGYSARQETMTNLPTQEVNPNEPEWSPAAQILAKGMLLVDGDRNKQHGERKENHRNIARLWTAYLGVQITPLDVALMMALLKIGRTKSGAYNEDDYTDGAAYLALAGEMAQP